MSSLSSSATPTPVGAAVDQSEIATQAYDSGVHDGGGGGEAVVGVVSPGLANKLSISVSNAVDVGVAAVAAKSQGGTDKEDDDNSTGSSSDDDDNDDDDDEDDDDTSKRSGGGDAAEKSTKGEEKSTKGEVKEEKKKKKVHSNSSGKGGDENDDKKKSDVEKREYGNQLVAKGEQLEEFDALEAKSHVVFADEFFYGEDRMKRILRWLKNNPASKKFYELIMELWTADELENAVDGLIVYALSFATFRDANPRMKHKQIESLIAEDHSSTTTSSSSGERKGFPHELVMRARAIQDKRKQEEEEKKKKPPKKKKEGKTGSNKGGKGKGGGKNKKNEPVTVNEWRMTLMTYGYPRFFKKKTPKTDVKTVKKERDEAKAREEKANKERDAMAAELAELRKMLMKKGSGSGNGKTPSPTVKSLASPTATRPSSPATVTTPSAPARPATGANKRPRDDEASASAASDTSDGLMSPIRHVNGKHHRAVGTSSVVDVVH